MTQETCPRCGIRHPPPCPDPDAAKWRTVEPVKTYPAERPHLPYGSPYWDGFRAGKDGYPICDVPYPEHDPRHMAWLRGWMDGRHADSPHAPLAPGGKAW